MSWQKVKVKMFGNNELSEEEGKIIWCKFIDIMRKKEIREKSSKNNKAVGLEENIKKIK